MRAEKVDIVADLQAKLSGSPYLLITEYTGLNVAQFADLRVRLGGAGAECRVVKNTFLRRAAQGAGLPELAELKGQTAIITGKKDVAAAAKVLKTFVAEFKKPVVKAGVLDNALLSSADIATIADLPSREILLAQLLGVLQSPAAKLVRLLNEPASALARILKIKADKEEKTTEEPKAEAAAAE